jgi:hypothetical protein
MTTRRRLNSSRPAGPSARRSHPANHVEIDEIEWRMLQTLATDSVPMGLVPGHEIRIIAVRAAGPEQLASTRPGA